jgi:hypothetical protein
MPNDRYTKIVLTVIAGALVALVAQNAIAPAQAQLGLGCGSKAKPCFVTGHVVTLDVDNISSSFREFKDEAGLFLLKSWGYDPETLPRR